MVVCIVKIQIIPPHQDEFDAHVLWGKKKKKERVGRERERETWFMILLSQRRASAFFSFRMRLVVIYLQPDTSNGLLK